MSVPVTGLFRLVFHRPWSSLWEAVAAVETVVATPAVVEVLVGRSMFRRTSHYLQGTPSLSPLVLEVRAVFGTVRHLRMVSPALLTRLQRSRFLLLVEALAARPSVVRWAYSNQVSLELEPVPLDFRLEQTRLARSTPVAQLHLGVDILREVRLGRTQIP
jgi:hypothetical protein